MHKAPTLDQLAAESWIWYGLCLLIVGCRFLSQSILRGTWRKLQIDDWLMILVTCTYTIVIVCTNELVKLCDKYVASTSAEYQAKMFKKIGVLELLLETSMVTTLWGVKACLLICYHRITSLQKHNIAVKVAAVYCAVGYIVVIVCLYGGFCRPFSNYFVVNSPNSQCNTFFKYSIVEICFNVSSAIFILFIPTTLVATSQIPWQRKTLLCLLFSLGIFSVISASLTKYFTFTMPLTFNFVLWYVREASTAMLVANLFLCLPLAKKIYSAIASKRSSWSHTGGIGGTNRSSNLPILQREPETEVEIDADVEVVQVDLELGGGCEK